MHIFFHENYLKCPECERVKEVWTHLFFTPQSYVISENMMLGLIGTLTIQIPDNQYTNLHTKT